MPALAGTQIFLQKSLVSNELCPEYPGTLNSMPLSAPPNQSHFQIMAQSMPGSPNHPNRKEVKNCPFYPEYNFTEEVYFHFDSEHNYCKYPPPC